MNLKSTSIIRWRAAKARANDELPEATVMRPLAAKRYWTVSVASVLIALASWQILTVNGVIPSSLLPSMQHVLHSGVEVATVGYQGATLLQDIGISLYRIGVGFVSAVAVGVPLGLMMGSNSIIESIFDPYIQFLRPLPPLGYYTLLIVWFGIGNLSKVTLLFLTALPIVVVSSAAGVKSIEDDLLLAVSSLGVRRFNLFRFVVFPACLPSIFTGLRLALGVTFGSLVAAELIAANSGLGWLILTAGDYVRTSIVFVGIIVIGVIALLLDRAMVWLQAVLVPWAGKQ